MEDIKKRNTRQRNWRKENMTELRAMLHNVNDSDILEALEKADNKAGLIKKALRFYLANNKEE